MEIWINIPGVQCSSKRAWRSSLAIHAESLAFFVSNSKQCRTMKEDYIEIDQVQVPGIWKWDQRTVVSVNICDSFIGSLRPIRFEIRNSLICSNDKSTSPLPPPNATVVPTSRNEINSWRIISCVLRDGEEEEVALGRVFGSVTIKSSVIYCLL